MPRRAVLSGGAVLAVPFLGGCDGAGVGSRTRPSAVPAAPEVTVLMGAIAAEEGLIALYESARAAHASLARRIDPALARHREHLAVLRRHYVPGSGDRAGEGSAALRPAPPRAPEEAAEALAALRRAESAAAAARAAEAGRVAPGLAQLLASVGACEAGHAAALARTS
ncbi:hypothetical protein ACFY4C_10620 [Actinomadura viridis]|uniref:hypothetical protein n=1 Tax=Actinomadura viridis TaxID=58110 RepID=UPI0036C4B7AD